MENPISWAQTFLVVVVLGSCCGCIWMVFFFGRRIQTWAYLRDSIVSAVRDEEFRNRLRALDERRRTGPLDNTRNPLPTGMEYLRLLPDEERAVSAPPDDYVPSGETDAQREARLQRQQEREHRQEIETNWFRKEREIYDELRQSEETIAKNVAESRVPTSIDISLLGGGWSFLLEFSTVIVIIFVLLALAVINAVPGKEGVTILASVAGYVLGKASSSAQRSQETPGVSRNSRS